MQQQKFPPLCGCLCLVCILLCRYMECLGHTQWAPLYSIRCLSALHIACLAQLVSQIPSITSITQYHTVSLISTVSICISCRRPSYSLQFCKQEKLWYSWVPPTLGAAYYMKLQYNAHSLVGDLQLVKIDHNITYNQIRTAFSVVCP